MLSTVGISFVLAVLLGALLGYWLDRWFPMGRYPVFFLIFTLFGVLGGVLNVFRASSKLK